MFNSTGISQITMSMANSVDWEVDHLHYGIAPAIAPEPSMVMLSLAAIIALGARHRRVGRLRRG